MRTLVDFLYIASKIHLMEISQFSDYALRVLIYAGLQGERCSVPEIAKTHDISHHHLVKVVHHLAKAGFLDTFRGRGGGIQLAKPPATFTVADVLRSTENLALVECLPPREGACCLSGCCVLKGAILKARHAFLTVLDGYSLKDLLLPRGALREALAMSPE